MKKTNDLNIEGNFVVSYVSYVTMSMLTIITINMTWSLHITHITCRMVFSKSNVEINKFNNHYFSAIL